MTMKLLLTSGGFTNKTIIKALADLLGKPFNKAKIVFVPTAANVESGGKEWLIDDMYRAKELGWQEIKWSIFLPFPRPSGGRRLNPRTY